MRLFVSFAALLFLLTACEKGLVFREYQDIAQLQWAREIVPSFKVKAPEGNPEMTLSIGFRHYSAIQKLAIPVELTMVTPSGESTSSKYEIAIRDQKGELLGQAMGDLTDIEVPIMEGFTMPETGEYTFKVAHTVEEDTLSGVLEVGLILKETAAAQAEQ